jgi:gliding motility-associated-like protein
MTSPKNLSLTLFLLSFSLFAYGQDVADGTSTSPETEQPNLAIPNAFTPNGDGVNDLFRPIVQGMQSFRYRIYDRNGQEVFTGSSNEAWQGNRGNAPAAEGVYFFTGEGTNTTGQFIRRVSSVTLLR